MQSFLYTAAVLCSPGTAPSAGVRLGCGMTGKAGPCMGKCIGGGGSGSGGGGCGGNGGGGDDLESDLSGKLLWLHHIL